MNLVEFEKNNFKIVLSMPPQQYFHKIDELFGFVLNFINNEFQINRKIVLNKDLFKESQRAASNLVTVHYCKEVLLLLCSF